MLLESLMVAVSTPLWAYEPPDAGGESVKLELDRVSFSYGDKLVLQNVSLTVSLGNGLL
jgi:ABC-type multidrug transport system fused ATPase/permease subunit